MPQKQALAIAYAVKRKAQKKAKGGEIDLGPWVEKTEGPTMQEATGPSYNEQQIMDREAARQRRAEEQEKQAIGKMGSEIERRASALAPKPAMDEGAARREAMRRDVEKIKSEVAGEERQKVMKQGLAKVRADIDYEERRKAAEARKPIVERIWGGLSERAMGKKYAHGGMINPKLIAAHTSERMKSKPHYPVEELKEHYAHGGMKEEEEETVMMGGYPIEEPESIHQEFDLEQEHMPEIDNPHDAEEKKEKRKRMISSIMQTIHDRHMGK